MLALGGCGSERTDDALLVLRDLAAGAGESHLKEVTPAPSRIPVAYIGAGAEREATLYLPGQGKPEAAIVLIPGAVRKGKDDPRLVAFATTLARARFVVLTPELSGYHDLQIRAGHVREIAVAFQHLMSRAELPPGIHGGIAAMSYAVGPAVLAALDEVDGTRVDFVLGVGGYYDLHAAIRFLTTGYFEEDGVQRYLEPDQYGRLVFAKTALQYLKDAKDRSLLDAMVEVRLKDPKADISPLARGLGPEGASVYRLLTNSDPRATAAQIDALPAPMIQTVDALTLKGRELARLQTRFILVHGKNDPLVPYTESRALSRALPHAHLFILKSVLAHVELSFTQVLSRRFWSDDVPDAWRLYRAIGLLLRERRPASKSDPQQAQAPVD
jgi:hypothetical protein